jgi:hypothetical protein
MKSVIFRTRKPETEGVSCHVSHFTMTALGSDTVYYSISFAKKNPVKYTDPTGRSQTVDLGKIGERGTEYGNSIEMGGWIAVGIIAGIVLTLGLLYFLSDDVKEIVNKGIDAIKNWARKHGIDISEDGLGKDVGGGKKIIAGPFFGIEIEKQPNDGETGENYHKNKPRPLPPANSEPIKPDNPGIPVDKPEIRPRVSDQPE